jgi:hypothetical protein
VENKKIENGASVNDSYVRIHMKVTTPSENEEKKYMFSLGLEHRYDCPVIKDSSSSSENCYCHKDGNDKYIRFSEITNCFDEKAMES